MTRRARLLGLDAPQQFEAEFTSPSPSVDEELKLIVEQIRGQIRLEVEQEVNASSLPPDWLSLDNPALSEPNP
jgi:hypothetical protein